MLPMPSPSLNSYIYRFALQEASLSFEAGEQSHRLTDASRRILHNASRSSGTAGPMSPSAMRIETAEVTNGLQQLRDEKTRLETMLVTIASDPGRRARLHHVAESIRGRLKSMAAHERRSVCELLDVPVTVRGWDDCPRCEGRRRVAGNGKANTCAVCHAAGRVPELEMAGV
jgi:hypothetical protein